MIRALPLGLIIAVSGCAYHASDIPEKEWVRVTVKLDQPYQQVFRNINQGADTCKYLFVREGFIYTDIKEAKINLFLRSMIGGSSGMVFGYIDIKENLSNTSDMQINLWNVYERSGKNTAKLSNWAKGNFSCE